MTEEVTGNADITTDATEMPAPETPEDLSGENMTDLSDGIPIIPDDKDNLSDQDAIDDILNQIGKLTK